MVFPLATSPTEAHLIIWRATLAVCVIANVIWYRVKFVLKAHGLPVSFIWHLSDVPNFHRLIRRETDGASGSASLGSWLRFTSAVRFSLCWPYIYSLDRDTLQLTSIGNPVHIFGAAPG